MTAEMYDVRNYNVLGGALQQPKFYGIHTFSLRCLCNRPDSVSAAFYGCSAAHTFSLVIGMASIRTPTAR